MEEGCPHASVEVSCERFGLDLSLFGLDLSLFGLHLSPPLCILGLDRSQSASDLGLERPLSCCAFCDPDPSSLLWAEDFFSTERLVCVLLSVFVALVCEVGLTTLTAADELGDRPCRVTLGLLRGLTGTVST